jgi:hypothetical protein
MTAAKFKPLIFSVSGFALSNIGNIFILLDDFWLLRLQRYKRKLKLIYDRQSVGQSVLVSGAHLGPVTNFSFAMKFPLDSRGFGIL